jgi:hypothetical protein
MQHSIVPAFADEWLHFAPCWYAAHEKTIVSAKIESQKYVFHFCASLLTIRAIPATRS